MISEGFLIKVKKRGEHIRNFYAKLYKKKIDKLMTIEDFLGRELTREPWLMDRKLNEDEKNSSEGIVHMGELEESLEASNFGSTSGWDGISFKVLRKLWHILGNPMLKMVNETFEYEEVSETFKLGLLKIILKKGNAEKVGDWRPITLLCCGYK